jgi:hypothetical protein
MTKNKPSKITKRHYVTLSDAAGSVSTLSVYGKLVKNAALGPRMAGIIHPKTPGETLILAQVVGFVNEGQCQRVTPPVMLTLPEPDGPADGCGWDPEQYVVWKDLPKNWVTLHLQTERRTLADTLSAGSSAGTLTEAVQPSTVTPLGVRDTVVKIVKSWANMPANPRGTDVLQALWAASNPPGPFPDAAQNLASQINDAFGTHLLGTDINPPGSIKTVDDLVSAVT